MNMRRVLAADKRFTTADLAAFLAGLKAHALDHRDRVGDVVRVFGPAEQTGREVETDRDAEFVRQGVRIGWLLAVLNRDTFYRDVQSRHRELGRERKASQTAIRNQRLVEGYRQLAPQKGCLGARRSLSKKYGIGVKQVGNVLRAAGVQIERKSE